MYAWVLNLAQLANQKYSAGFIVAVVAVVALVYLGDELREQQITATTDNAYNIVDKAFKQSVSCKDDFLKLVVTWKKDGWTAQTGSLKTLCNNSRDRILDFATADKIDFICVLVH